MFIEYKLEGKFVSLRSVEESDAEFILNVRNDPRISKYLPPLNVTLEQQREWISKQRADNESYYFVLETPQGNSIGTLSVYNIEGNHAESGRSCCIGEPYHSIEANTLLTDFTFKTLKLDYIIVWVYEDNKPVISLNQSLGCEWVEKKVDEGGKPFWLGVCKREKALEINEKIRKQLNKLHI